MGKMLSWGGIRFKLVVEGLVKLLAGTDTEINCPCVNETCGMCHFVSRFFSVFGYVHGKTRDSIASWRLGSWRVIKKNPVHFTDFANACSWHSLGCVKYTSTRPASPSLGPSADRPGLLIRVFINPWASHTRGGGRATHLSVVWKIPFHPKL